jgi:protoporphyrinogen/coproporphyrinogen III oxidase
VASAGVVGAGAAGLAAAYRLTRLGHDVTVYEASDRAGGSVRTERRDGFLAEHGPNSMQAPTESVAHLFRELGLDEQRVEAAPAARTRYIVRAGRPQALPLSPPAVLTSSFFSPRARLALLTEPLAAAPPQGDESIAAFVRRRFGAEFLDYAAGPFVSGVYAGDPEALSMRHALPKLHALEREHGSVLLGGLKAGRRRRPEGGRAPALISFRDGMEELVGRLAGALRGRVRLQHAVLGVRRAERGWIVETAAGAHAHDGLVLAAPAHALAALPLAAASGDRLRELEAIPHPGVAALVLGFRRDQVTHPLDGFGVLAPAVERRRILGALFSSSLFPNRAPEGHVTLTVFAGGVRQPDVFALDPAALEEMALAELADLLGVSGTPVFRTLARWPRAIPQYVLGYDRFLEALGAIEAANPALRFAGSYRSGVSLGDTLRSGLDAADALHARLSSR